MLMVMDPQQAPPSQPPQITGPQSPYDFILNEPVKQKKSLLPSGNSKQQRIIIVAGVGLIVVVLALVLFAAIAGSNSSGRELLISVAQKQTELVRVADRGNKDAREAEAKNLAALTQQTLNSDLQTTLVIAQKSGKISNKVLVLGKSTKTDQELDAAAQSNRFDEAFLKVIVSDLTDYRKALKAAYSEAKSDKDRAALQVLYKHAGTLLQEKTPDAAAAN